MEEENVTYKAAIFLFIAILCFSLLILTPLYFKACYKAELINSQYGTHYTPQQVFFAEDVIDEIKELNRNRHEINGDIFQQRGGANDN